MTQNRFAHKHARDDFEDEVAAVAARFGLRMDRWGHDQTIFLTVFAGSVEANIEIFGGGPDIPYMIHWLSREDAFSLEFSAAVGGSNRRPHHKETTIEDAEDVFFARLVAGLRMASQNRALNKSRP